MALISLVAFMFACLQIMMPAARSNDLDLSMWMQQRSETLWNMKLSDLSLLGTHDSGAYNLSQEQQPGYEPEYLEVMIYVAEQKGVPVEKVITDWGKAQPSNLFDQMMNGVRYIDLRCGWLEATQQWHTFHWEVGHTIHTLMDDVARFLQSHPAEIVLIEATHLEGVHIDDRKLQKLVAIFEDSFNKNSTKIGLFPRYNDSVPYFPTYGEMITMGYRVFLSLSDTEIAGQFDNIQFGNVFENSYADSDNLTYMMEFNDAQIQRFNQHQTNPNALYKISWTLTPSSNAILRSLLPHEPQTLLELAEIANQEMCSWTQKYLKQNQSIGNIFLFDDYPTAATQQILTFLYDT